MAHISQLQVNFIHQVVVSEGSAHWDPLVMQWEQLRGGVTPTPCTLTFLEYLYSLRGQLKLQMTHVIYFHARVNPL